MAEAPPQTLLQGKLTQTPYLDLKGPTYKGNEGKGDERAKGEGKEKGEREEKKRGKLSGSRGERGST